MPTVAIVEGVLILFYFNDHDSPHFRSQSAAPHARIAIEDGSVFDETGRMSVAQRRRLRDWAGVHRAALMEDWHLARAGQPLKRIGGMTTHRIARAMPRRDFTVDIEWTDGTRSAADLKPEIARGDVLADLGEPAVFLRRMFIHAEGESLAWEVFGQVVDFHANNLWAASHAKPAAAE